MISSRISAASNDTRPRRLASACCALVLCGALAGCTEREREPVNAGFAALTVQGPVGPLPGGAEAAPTPNPYRDDPVALAEGRRYFVAMNCAGCHGGHAGGGMGPSLRDVTWLYGGGDGDIFDSIAQGRANGMPAWGSMLPADLIWRITAYITSLGTSAEPSPPR
jgi:cytochrome c oxidase cbb3-type subunit 3